MPKVKIDLLKEEIRELGLDAIKEYFKVDVRALDAELIKALHKKAALAVKFDSELSVDKRAVELNYIRVFKLIAEDRADLKKLIKKSLPEYLK